MGLLHEEHIRAFRPPLDTLTKMAKNALQDDRGRPFQFAPVDGIESSAPRSARRALRLAQHYQRGSFGLGLVGVFIAVCVFVAPSLVMLIRAGYVSLIRPWLNTALGVFIVAGALTLVVGPLWWRSRLTRSRAAILTHGFCPSCGYCLRGIPTEDDGCRVCPECAAAWRLPA